MTPIPVGPPPSFDGRSLRSLLTMRALSATANAAKAPHGEQREARPSSHEGPGSPLSQGDTCRQELTR